MAAIL
jgi:hypothetical protein